ncbi:glycoside hydrolase family 127 protein [Fulvivirga sediminis]|uniref:Glycoside hydrolase family 127 protein n=1 Tax=Fulvivirga sediminis TaxID=2803949 RepID=A0A937F6E6_9BACT|nr:glycoside hydrolase family 127 protein [Fulvivirga sediminis]MBL3655852.1 glycoside hydrolase family 127 protein [Fulvivirga sediminis]
MKNILLSLCVAGLISCDPPKHDVTEGSLAYFSLENVQLLESPFLHAQQLDKDYLLKLKPDRLLAPFLREAGLEPKAESYTNWENTGLDGHIGGHYVSALSLMYASTHDEEIGQRLDYMLSELRRCQQANGNGYIGGVPGGKAMWEEIAKGDIRAGSFSLNDKWVPLYNIHKTYSGLKDAYVYASKEQAKEMLISMTDWMLKLVSGLSDEQIQNLLKSEHGGLNEAFADVAGITGEDKYLTLAKRFSHQQVLEPLVRGKDNLTGMHANTQIPKVIGFERIAEMESDSSWHNAASFFWNDVVNDRTVSIGGNSSYEHFHPKDDFTQMIQGTQGPETCNTYNMLKLTKMLYQQMPERKYISYYEKALYNHILSSQNPKNGGLVYFTQMRPGHYRVYSQPQTSFWCCVGSGIENHAKYGEMIYAHTNESLIVNLFIPSQVKWKEKGIELIQENHFPEEEATHFEVKTLKDEAVDFTLSIRNPEWAEAVKVMVNGEAYTDYDQQAEYIRINRSWKSGDKIEVSLPMRLQAEQLPDGQNYYAFEYGPIVLAAKTGEENLKGLFADDSRGGHIASGEIIPLTEVPVVLSEPDQLLEKVTKKEPLKFNLEVVQPNGNNTLELIPFYQLHEARYAIYFPQFTQEELSQKQEEMALQEKMMKQLEAITVDKVSSGEQQPESDHFVKQEGTWTGYNYERHYREGGGWFSYEMKNVGKKAKFLQVNYLDVDQNRACNVYINDKKIGEIVSNGEQESSLQKIEWNIPAGLLKEDQFTVKIEAKDKLWMLKVVGVRLLSSAGGNM